MINGTFKRLKKQYDDEEKRKNVRQKKEISEMIKTEVQFRQAKIK